MAKKKASSILKSAKVFINENDEAIEKEVYSNVDTIESEYKKQGYLKKAHRAIIEALGLESIEDSKYFDGEVFENMVVEKVSLKKERKRKAEEKKAEVEQKQKEELPRKANQDFQNP